MGQKKSEFDKVFSAWDILVIAFGAMIGWGWVVSSGTWIDAGGVVGAALAFAIGGVMIFFVGLTYAELTAAMPQCGGEHVFSYKAMGPTGSFICTWAIILGYVGVTCFEACAGTLMEAVYRQNGDIITYLSSTDYDGERISKNIDVPVAHKIGDAYDFKHDVAIVYADSPFILSIFTDKEGYDKITSIADDVYGILK